MNTELERLIDDAIDVVDRYEEEIMRSSSTESNFILDECEITGAYLALSIIAKLGGLNEKHKELEELIRENRKMVYSSLGVPKKKKK